MARTERVLIVDDTPTMRLIVTGMLEDLGFGAPVQAESAETALKLLVGQHFDLVLADWNMGGRSGLDLLRSIRSRAETARLPVVMMTSNNDPEQISEARAAGISSYLVKPFGPADLYARMQEAFQTHSSHPPVSLDRNSGE